MLCDHSVMKTMKSKTKAIPSVALPEPKSDPGRCAVCGKSWLKHYGIQRTCAWLAYAVSALRVLRTWARFRDGECLDPDAVVRLVDRVIGEVEAGKLDRRTSRPIAQALHQSAPKNLQPKKR